MEPHSAIYGLGSQARAVCADRNIGDQSRFIAGTLAPNSEGVLHILDYDEDENKINREVYKTSLGEIWQVQTSVNSDKNLVSVRFNDIRAEIPSAVKRVAILELSSDSGSIRDNSNTTDVIRTKEKCTLENENDVMFVDWHPGKNEKIACVFNDNFEIYDLSTGCFKLDSSASSESLYLGKWNPHLDGTQFSLLSNETVKGIDTRSMKVVWTLNNAHSIQVRDIDFNPNKQYCFGTAGDDCKVKFWDFRNLQNSLKEIKSHTHWVWQIRYNICYDQLVLTSGSDSRVVLHTLPSISSRPGQAEHDDSNGNEVTSEVPKDEILEKYEDHEDAVYGIEWSVCDPWLFASLSYDGRLVINRVPQENKYKILL